MSALPRPDLPPGAHRDLVTALHELHHHAGWPSLRTLAREAGISHTTVSKTFSTIALPTWGTLELLVEAMAGDTTAFHDRWLAATTPTNGAPPTALRIAGRTAELAAVRTHLETGRGLLLVTGEAGMGKTKLVTTAAARTETFVATGHCLPLSTQVPLLPIADVLREAHAVDDGDWLAEALADASPYVAESLGLLLPELDRSGGAMSHGDSGWSRQRLFTAIGAALAKLASLRPFAVILEDLHWADDATLDLVEHLVAAGSGLPLTGTWRIDDPTTPADKVEWWSRVRRLSAVATLDLQPLNRQDTAEQLELLATAPPSAELVDRIHERTQGQPLFTEQLAAQIDDDHHLPRLLGDLLDRRLDGLHDPGRAVAVCLAVADRALTDSQLREVTGLASGALAEGLRQLADRRLLFNSDHDAQLRHPLLAEAVRRSMVLSESVDAHRSIASAMAGWSEASAAEVAAHWQSADEHDRELEWRILAARQAGARFASAQEAEQWRRVIALWGDDHVTKRHGVSLAEAYWSGADALDYADQAVVATALMEEAAVRLHDVEGLDKARLLTLLGTLRGYIDPAAGLRVLEEALTAYRDLPPTADYIDLLLIVVGTLETQGRRGENAARLVHAAEVAARGGFVDRHKIVLTWQAWDQVLYDGHASGWNYLDEAHRLIPVDPHPLGDIHCAMVHADLLRKTSAPAEDVRDAAEVGLRVAEEWGIDSWTTSRLRYLLIEASLNEGRMPPEAEIIRQDTSPLNDEQHWLHLIHARLEMLSGNLAAATEMFEDLDQLTLWTLHQCDVDIHAVECLLWRGEPKRALDLVTAILHKALPTEHSLFQGGLLSRAARAACDLGRASVDNRRRVCDLRSSALFDPFDPDRGAGDAHAHGLTWNAEIARFDQTETIDLWVKAATEWDRLTRPHDAAYCRWRGAQVALREGQGTIAARLLKRAATDSRERVPLHRAIRATAGVH